MGSSASQTGLERVRNIHVRYMALDKENQQQVVAHRHHRGRINDKGADGEGQESTATRTDGFISGFSHVFDGFESHERALAKHKQVWKRYLGLAPRWMVTGACLRTESLQVSVSSFSATQAFTGTNKILSVGVVIYIR